MVCSKFLNNRPHPFLFVGSMVGMADILYFNDGVVEAMAALVGT